MKHRHQHITMKPGQVQMFDPRAGVPIPKDFKKDVKMWIAVGKNQCPIPGEEHLKGKPSYWMHKWTKWMTTLGGIPKPVRYNTCQKCGINKNELHRMRKRFKNVKKR